MNIAEELTKVRDDVVKKFDTVIAWAQGGFSGVPLAKRPHRRLKVFMDEYHSAFGTVYEIRDHAAEGGAAKRTETKSNDVDYLEAVRAYLADRPQSFGAPFFKFESKIDFWLNQVRGKKAKW